MSMGDAERYVSGVKTEVAIARTRARVAALHISLARHGVIVWNVGAVSERVPGSDLFVIKASGIPEDELAPENMVLCDADGSPVPETPGSDRAPSSDATMHAELYRASAEIGGIVHTHSGYAAAWSARGEDVPCVTTAMAEEFGGPVPAITAADDRPAAAISAALATQPSRAVLVRGHGSISVGPSAKAAVKTAIALEDAARTVQLARQGGDVAPLAPAAVERRFAESRSRDLQITDDRR